MGIPQESLNVMLAMPPLSVVVAQVVRAMAFTLCRRGSNPRTDLAIGSDGGASGRAKAICPCRPGSNPRTDLAFLVQNCCLSILNGLRAFSKNE